MKNLKMIHRAGVAMNQLMNGRGPLLEPRRRVPHPPIFLGVLAALGLWLALAWPAQADCPLPTVNAGSHQVITNGSSIQLAGSVGNADSSTWSGGSGTFNPDANTLNALYTPSAVEFAAGSWALTLTASNSCGTATSTMSFNIAPAPVTLPLDASHSTAAVDVRLDPIYSGSDLGTKDDSSVNYVAGYVVLQLDTNGQPREVSLQDYHMAAQGPYELNYHWSVLLIGNLDAHATASNVAVTHGDPGPQNPFYPVVNGDQFTISPLPYSSTGAAAYDTSGLYSTSGTLPLDQSGSSANTAVSTIDVVNGVATMHMNFTLTDTIDESSDSFQLLATYTITAVALATGPMPAYSRALVWNNGAGTGNWNTNDFNWNRSTALWRNINEVDSAVFGADGIGTVTLTKPITARGLDFESPGYTIAGSSLNPLALSGASAITNNADATIAGVIASGALNKWGGSTLTLSGANTYSGGTWVNAGTLQITSDDQLGALPGSPAVNLTLNGGQLFNNASALPLAGTRNVSLGAGGGYVRAGSGDPVTINGQIAGAGGLGVVWDYGAVVLNGVNSYAGATTIGVTGNSCWGDPGANPTLQLGSAGALPGTGLIFGSSAYANTARLDLHGYNATVAALTGGANAIVDNLSSSASALTVGNNGASGTFSGVIQNTAGTVYLTKIGNGTITLAGANTYGGNTTISAGTLALSGGGSLAGSVTIAAGTTFDVSGVSGAYSLGSGATLTANGTASPATINGPAGTLDLGGKTIALNIDGTDPALTVSQGTLNLDGSTLNVTKATGLDDGATYPLIQLSGPGAVQTNSTVVALETGWAGTLSVSGSQVLLTVQKVFLTSYTSVGPVATPQTFGSVVLHASVYPAEATGDVAFYSDGVSVGTNTLSGGTVTCAAIAHLVPVGSHTITAKYLGKSDAPPYYAGSVSTNSLPVTVQALTVHLGGSKTFDKTKTVTPAGGLTIVPDYDDGNVYLTPSSGVVYLAGYNAGSEAIISCLLTNGPVTTATNVYSVPSNANQIITNVYPQANYNTPTRVQVQGATGGSWSSKQNGSFSVGLNGTGAGNTLVAVINTDSDGLNRVSSLSGAGGWTRLGQSENGTSCPWGSETEMWYAPNIGGGATSVTVNVNSTAGLTCFVLAEAVVLEYGNVTAAPLDQYSQASGGSSPAQSGTVTTSAGQYEVWVAGLGTANSGGYSYLSGQSSGWAVQNSQSKNVTLSGTGTYNTIYAFDRIVSDPSSQSASCSAEESSGTAWAGVIGTFKSASWWTTNYTYTYYTTNNAVTLAGPAAGNYTLVYSGTVTINPYPITVAATIASKTYDGTTTAAGSAAVTPTGGTLIAGDTYSPPSPGQAFSSRNAAVGNAVIVPGTITVSDGNGGNNYSVAYNNYSAGTINPKALTVLGLSAESKTYDGTNSAALSGTAAFEATESPPGTSTDGAPYNVDGVSPGGTVLGAFDTPYVGTNKTVNVTGVTVTGTGSANYTATQPSLTADITNLVVELTGSKNYDGTTNVPAEDLSVANNYDGTNLTLLGSATLPNRNVGDSITILSTAGLTLGGSMATNYTLTDATGSVTVAATNLTVTAADDIKLYDGTANSAATPTISAGGIQTDDTAPAWTESYDTRNVGAGLTLTVAPQPLNDGNSGLNYNVSYATGLGVIQPTNLTVTATPDTKTYDGTTSATNTPTITSGSIQTGDTAPVWTEAYDTPNAGTGKTLTPAALTVADGNYGTNYSYTYNSAATGEIDPLGTTTLLTSLPNPSLTGANVTFTATVTGVAPAADLPTGYVVFLADGTPFATNGPLVAGIGTSSITASTASLPAGDNAMTVQYLGDGNFQPSASSPLTQVVTNGGLILITNLVADVTNCAGAPAIFTVGAMGGDLTYQWQVSGDSGTTFTNISDTATNASYTNLVSTPDQSGYLYQVIVSGSGAPSVISAPPAVLIVNTNSWAYAGPNQCLPAGTATIQLAGSVGNGVTGGTWSGGFGTFSDTRDLHAVYAPSAREIAAGSWALTLTSDDAGCGAGTSTMSFTFIPAVTLPLITDQSSAGVDVILAPLGLPAEEDASTNNLEGYVVLQLATNGPPTVIPNGQPAVISVQDFNMRATGPYALNYAWVTETNGSLFVAGSATNVAVANSQPGPQNPLYPVYDTDLFSLTNFNYAGSGMLDYAVTGIFTSGGTLPFDESGTITNGTTGIIIVTNGVAWMQLNFSFTDTINEGDGLILATYTIGGVAVASGPAAGAVSRALVWNNGAGTGNWDTSDANWNVGTAIWNNIGPDGAVFTNTGVGMVSLTQPITASWLWFSDPGYTITGSGLSLSGASAITNDADATISAAITSGALNKWGGSKLTLSGANTYTGATTVGAGILEYSNPASLGSTSQITVQSGAEVYFDSAFAGATVSNPIALNGVGIDGGALHTFVPGGQITFAGPITLQANSQIFGQAAASSTINLNSVIGGNYDLTFLAGGIGGDQDTFVLSAANTYGGNTYINNSGATAEVQLSGGNNRLPTGTVVYMSAPANSSVLDLNGNNQTLAGLADGASTAGTRSVTSSTASTLTLGGAGAYAFSGTVDGNLALTKTGAGAQTLSGVNTYTGNTTISAGSLALGSGGSLASASSVSIASGATFDVSAVTGGTYTLGSGATLTASGTAANPATVNGPSGGTVDLGSQPIILNYDGAAPALTISQGALSLNGNAFTVNTTPPLNTGDYIVVQQAGGSIGSSGSYTVTGSAIAAGSTGSIEVNGGQVILHVTPSAIATTTALGPVTDQAYGSLVLSATVSAAEAVTNGQVTFKSGSATLAVVPVSSGAPATASLATNLAVGSYAIQALFNDPAVVYSGSASSVSNLTITARAVVVSGSKTYDGLATITNSSLTIVNNVDGANLTLSGSAVLSGRNVGSQSVIPSTVAAPVRVQRTAGTTGNLSQIPIAYSATLTNAPANGNTLVAVIATRGTNLNQVYSITQTGATWSRAVQAANANGTTTEIWYAPGVQSAGTVVTITNSTKVRAAAVIFEYSGVLAISALDRTASTFGSGTSAVTGTTAITAQPTEVWVGGIGLTSSGYTLSSIVGGFAAVFTNSTSSTPILNARVYALEKIVSATDTANSGGTISTASQWSGAMATFIGVPGLALDGSAAPNYTLATVSGSVTVSQSGLTVTAASNTKLYDGTISASATPTITAGSIQSGDTAPAWTEAYADKNAGTSKTLTPAGVVLDGNGGANYDYTYAQDFTGQIDLTNLTVTAVSDVKLYDGTTTSVGTPTVTAGAIQTGDTEPVWTQTFDDRNVGTSKTLTPAGLVSDGNGGANYSYTYAPDFTGEIDQTNLTVTAATNTKKYDGGMNALATPTVTAGSIQTGDSAPTWTETYDTADVGTSKTLTPAGVVLDGNGGANYNYTYEQDFTGVITILTTTTLLSADVNPSGVGSNVTFTATVTAADPYPTGDVVFSANGMPFATNGLSMLSSTSSVVTASTTSLPAGTNTIGAQYLGGLDYLPSASDSLAQVVTNNVIYSHTNIITSISNNHNGTFTLNAFGTPGAEYYVVTNVSLSASMTLWTRLEAGNHPAGEDGKWSCTVSNSAPAYYRVQAVNPAP
jgi:autotransporter-associated beta strand protein